MNNILTGDIAVAKCLCVNYSGVEFLENERDVVNVSYMYYYK